MIWLKKCCFLITALFLIITNPYNTRAAVNDLILDNCDEFNNINAMSSTKISLDDFYKKEGTGALKVSDSGAFIIAQFTFEKPINGLESLDFNSIYLEFWLYVTDDAVLNNKPSQMELSSNEEPDVDEYAWDLSKYKYSKGWNRISLKLTDASKIGTPDLSKIVRLRFYSVVKSKATFYLDEIILTDSPRVISNDQLGVVSIGESMDNTVYQFTDFNTRKLDEASDKYKRDIFFTSMAVIIFCLSSGYLILMIVLVRKKQLNKSR